MKSAKEFKFLISLEGLRTLWAKYWINFALPGEIGWGLKSGFDTIRHFTALKLFKKFNSPIKSIALWWLIKTIPPESRLMFSSPWISNEAPKNSPTLTMHHAGILTNNKNKHAKSVHELNKIMLSLCVNIFWLFGGKAALIIHTGILM